MDSILNSVKKQIGIHETDDSFDPDIIMAINTVFVILNRVGVGPSKGFSIKDQNSIWADFISEDDVNFEAVKTYVGAKARFIFDPPTSSVAIDALEKSIKEIEWRLNVAKDT